MAVIDIAGFVADLKDHAVEHGFHVHDERHFVLEIFHGERSPEDLARTLGVTTNTVYSRKFKVRAKLARIVAHLESGGIAA